MKKLFLLLLTASLLTLSSCKFISSVFPALDTDSNLSGEDLNNKDVTENEDDDFLMIHCRSASDYTEKNFGLKESKELFRLTVPVEWKFSKEDNRAYTITRDGAKIGTIIWGNVSDSDEWTTVSTSNNSTDGILIKQDIEKFGSGDSLNFRFRFSYTYTDSAAQQELTLTVNYSEVDSSTLTELIKGIGLVSIDDFTRFNDLSNLKDSSILILGNSFINYSKIGAILNEMAEANDKSLQVNAISRGYATVNTYISDGAIMSDIENGVYSAVFICGLYSSSEVKNLGILKSACENSGTTLVVFPAHNEKVDVIANAKLNHNDLYFMDWKEEINSFIETGIDKYTFCYNDTYSHSNSLAGYVGAHMIYRAIYGEAPVEAISATISQEYVNSILGSYVQLSFIEKAINYFD